MGVGACGDEQLARAHQAVSSPASHPTYQCLLEMKGHGRGQKGVWQVELHLGIG